MGAVQWTNFRFERLLELYFQEAGLDTESAEFQAMVQDCWHDQPYERVYLTEKQVRVAEIKMFSLELVEGGTYGNVYPHYLRGSESDATGKVKSATKIIKKQYIQNGSLPERTAAALRWHEDRYHDAAE